MDDIRRLPQLGVLENDCLYRIPASSHSCPHTLIHTFSYHISDVGGGGEFEGVGGWGRLPFGDVYVETYIDVYIIIRRPPKLGVSEDPCTFHISYFISRILYLILTFSQALTLISCIL